MRRKHFGNIFFTPMILLTFAFTLVFSNYSWAQKTYSDMNLGEVKNDYFSVFKEGQKVDENAVTLDDFLIVPEKEYKANITYVDSISANNNKLGYFIVPKDKAQDTEKIKKEDITKEVMIFDGAKNIEKGINKEIGPFKPDDYVGFFIESENSKFYSVKSLNEDKSNHSAKYKNSTEKNTYVALGFEDTTLNKSDRDYNDILFTIEVEDHDFPDLIALKQLIAQLQGMTKNGKFSTTGKQFDGKSDFNGVVVGGIGWYTMDDTSSETKGDGNDSEEPNGQNNGEEPKEQEPKEQDNGSSILDESSASDVASQGTDETHILLLLMTMLIVALIFMFLVVLGKMMGGTNLEEFSNSLFNDKEAGKDSETQDEEYYDSEDDDD